MLLVIVAGCMSDRSKADHRAECRAEDKAEDMAEDTVEDGRRPGSDCHHHVDSAQRRSMVEVVMLPYSAV